MIQPILHTSQGCDHPSSKILQNIRSNNSKQGLLQNIEKTFKRSMKLQQILFYIVHVISLLKYYASQILC